ncbi:armadillo-type protein [Chlamydoabsidia padenii]|nr:armadillo-type protein [Chlamydoabsidia padenii]
MSYDSRGQQRSRNDGRRYNGGNNRDYRGGGGNRYRDDYRKRNYRQPSPGRDDELEDIQERLKGLIIKIGDKITPDLKVNLNKMKNILDNDFEKYPTMVQETLEACVTEIPTKTPIYGTLIGLLNESNSSIVEQLMESFNNLLKKSVDNLDWFKLKQLVRFYGELVNTNVVLPTNYIDLLNDILFDLTQPKQLKRRLDCLVYIVLSALPWCGEELNGKCPSGLADLLTKIGAYMDKRGSTHLSILKVFHDEKDQDALFHLWELIQDLQKNDWTVALIPKVHKWFNEELNSELQHDIPRVTLPPSSDASSLLQPPHSLRIFGNENAKINHPDHDSLNYFILNDTITDTTRIFESNRKECAKYLLTVFSGFEPGHFLSQADDDNDDRIDGTSLDWNGSEILMESLLAQMFALPKSSYRLIFFSTLMAELVRMNTRTFPMALGRSVKLLFDKLPNMDAECISRFWTWFGHHLSNFGFQWDWIAWEDAVSLDKMHPQVCFIRETIEKEIRLSYFERIKSSLPEEFASLAPSQAPAPNFSYASPDHPLNSSAKKVVEALRSKKSVEELRELLDNIKQEIANQEPDEVARACAVQDLFVQCLLLVGCKSFSHVLNVVERYLEVMRHLNGTHEEKMRTVKTVATFWKSNTQFLCILLDKLLNYRIVDPTSVIAWVFESDQLENAGRSYIWDILKNTLNKVVSRASQIKNRLESFRQLHADNEIKRAANPVTELTQAESQQELDTIHLAESSMATVAREQKEVFMVAYQRFTQVLQTLLTSLSAQARDPEEDWTFWWVYGWFKEVLRLYHDECAGFKVTLETVVFTSDLDSRITNLFQQIQEWNGCLSMEL